tara:strand:+ start:691 stop:2532 length:1842 start_codon:yes stop_codon:yes gene_type:complete
LLLGVFPLSILLSIIQNDLISTRWFYLGSFTTGDSRDYYEQAVEFLFNDNFYTDKGRVFFPIIYAGMLKSFNLNISNIQFIITILSTATVFFSSLQIKKFYGFVPSLIALFLSVDFLHENIGGVCTENIGYILGATSTISLLYFFNNKNSNLFYFFYGLILLTLSLLIRPGAMFLLIFIISLSLFFSIKTSKKRFIYVILIAVFSLYSVDLLNKYISKKYSPESPIGFSNAVDSWYATIVLGRYINNNKYNKLPNTLWTYIYKENPELLEKIGKEKSQNKNKIFINKIKDEPYNFLIGSIELIKNFFKSSRDYFPRFDNTRGFLFIDFVIAKVLITFLFILGLIFSVFNMVLHKDIKGFIVLGISLSIILSQPFLFGGESRTAASTIIFSLLVIIYGLRNIIKLFNSLLKKKYNSFNVKNNLNNENKVMVFPTLMSMPIVILTTFFLIGVNKNMMNLEKYNTYDASLICTDNKELKNLLFHSDSGFFISNHSKKKEKNYYNFEKFLNLSSDKAVIFRDVYGINYSLIEEMSEQEINDRDSFPLFTSLYHLVINKLINIDLKEKNLYASVGNIAQTGGGFFVEPLNFKTGKLEKITVLPLESIILGINKLTVCY